MVFHLGPKAYRDIHKMLVLGVITNIISKIQSFAIVSLLVMLLSGVVYLFVTIHPGLAASRICCNFVAALYLTTITLRSSINTFYLLSTPHLY